MIVKPSSESVIAQVAAAVAKGAPPVHLWNPPFCGDIDMRIARDGTWFHDGSPIGRPAMVRLFASILWREGDRYFLVTPAEKVGIRVDDAPFVAVDFEGEGSGRDQVLIFETNVGDKVTAGPDHPIRMPRDAATGAPSPYIRIRRNLEALIDRKSYYRLIDLGCTETHEGQSWFGLRSDGLFFPLLPSADMP